MSKTQPVLTEEGHKEADEAAASMSDFEFFSWCRYKGRVDFGMDDFVAWVQHVREVEEWNTRERKNCESGSERSRKTAGADSRGG